MVMKMEMSKTYQYRKVMKPMLERKRRARINKCLDDLKDLMVECLKQEGEHVTRLEKADILELTVDHMKKLKQRGTLNAKFPTKADCFRSGFFHAADQVSKVLASAQGVDVEVGTQLMTYLGNRLNQICQTPILRSQPSSAPVSPDKYERNSVSPSGSETSEYNHLCDPPSEQGYRGHQSKVYAKRIVDISSTSDIWRPW